MTALVVQYITRKPTMKKHIFVTGFMGAGKSKTGLLLAEEFTLPFYDSDKLIEEEAGKNIQQIFEEDGEASFRKMESAIIEQVSGYKYRAVIALGGGALMNKKNFDLITKNGILVYIKSSPQAIYERIKHSKKRPLLNIEEGENSKEKILSKIRSLLQERSDVYEKADMISQRDDMSLNEILKKMFDEVNKRMDTKK